ncbi:hypothetical protein ACIRA0001_0760 [Acinetobacter radioresistens SK82]|uniref:Uncharacterized protein n=1 Tax=Acinetobacter radioresistens SK82 TaxID=596318 RepID=A0ABP2GQ94_ACIRA|nr:hypothetical protein ACIRA0001_0760 [Acinetobacter radioresistens SK82]
MKLDQGQIDLILIKNLLGARFQQIKNGKTESRLLSKNKK